VPGWQLMYNYYMKQNSKQSARARARGGARLGSVALNSLTDRSLVEHLLGAHIDTPTTHYDI
jgi:hypothetical protein